MKAIFNNTIKISEYKPIYQMNGKWYVCFWCNEVMENARPVLKGGRYVKSNNLVSTGMCSYSYFVYDTKPSIKVIQDDIENMINSVVSNKIINNFIWNGVKINLSKENQMNYKANYDLAVQTDGQNLPIRIKAMKNCKTEYLIFFTVDEFTKFYVALNKHINNMLEMGWEMKDNMDYSVYNV
jgi:hypothetical protein